MEHIRGHPCSSGNFSQWSEKKSLQNHPMKPVSVKPVFIETGLEPVLKPVSNELKPVLKCLPKDEIT